MHAVTGYLHDLFGEPASYRGAAPAAASVPGAPLA